MATAMDVHYQVGSGETAYFGMDAPPVGWTGDVVVAGDSLTALTYQSRPYGWGYGLTRCPPRIIYNAGVANDTIQDLIDRFAADVTSKGAAIADIRIGTNGPGTGTYQDRFGDLFDLLDAAGMKAIFRAIPPKGLGTPGVDSPLIAENAWLQAQCEAAPDRLRFVEDSNDLGDAHYNVISSYYIDNIHFNGKGQYTVGDTSAPLLAAIIEQDDPRITDPADIYPANPASDQWCQNPFMAGTGGTKFVVTGTVPNNWGVSISGGGTTGVCSIEPADVGAADQTPWMRIAITAIGGNAHSVTASSRLSHPAIAADATIKRLDCVAEVRFVGFDPTNVTSLGMFVDAASVDVGSNLTMAMGTGVPTLDETLVIRHSLPRNQSGVALAAYASNTLDINIKLSFSGAAASSIGYLDIRNVSVRGQTT